MRQVDIYIESIANSGNYEKLELFNDEEILINSSIQNIQDLAKVYTDFTQSFTIPASPHNNRLFEHFYQTDVNAVNNPNIRRNAFIEIGTIPFRSGKMSIESSNVVKGRVESYSVTFYGDLTSLKDAFGDDTLKDLNLSSYGMFYSGFGVKARLLNANSQDIKFPLITSKRHWTYGLGTSTCIDTVAGAIVYNELFPALKVKRIFDAIQSKYGVTFNSLFFNQKLFTELFLWLKNSKDFLAYTKTVDVTFNPPLKVKFSSNSVDFSNTKNSSIDVKFTSATVGVRVFLDTYLNGKLIKTTEINNITFSRVTTLNLFNGTNIFTFKVRTSAPCSIVLYFFAFSRDVVNGITQPSIINLQDSDSLTFTSPYIDPSVYVPNMKISDFVSGVFKMFNLTCYATSVGNFQVEPLDDWYNQGAVIDITKLVDTDEIVIERHKLYKEISFDYEKSESYLNESYFNITTNATREFGNVKQSYSNYDGGEYKVDVPFENLYFAKENINNATEPPRGYLLNEPAAVDSYDNKPILLYLDSYTSQSFYFNDGTTTSLITDYRPLCNQIKHNNTVYSNHFSTEPSAFDGVTISDSLYQTYYNPYLQNLFNQKNRITNVKALFPISLLTSLKLNDRLIIRDKRYIINEMKVNLTTGDVDLALINDFRPVVNINLPVVAASGGVVQVALFIGNNNTAAGFSWFSSGGTVTYTADTLLDLTIPANTSGFPTYYTIYREFEVYATIYQDA